MINNQWNIAPEVLEQVFSAYGLALETVFTDREIAGSPERAFARAVAKDLKGKVWLVEKLSPEQRPQRNRVGDALIRLKRGGFRQIPRMLPTLEGEYVLKDQNGLWQLTRYYKGTKLDRPGYLDHGDLGQSLGDFMAGLHQNSPEIEDIFTGVFWLGPYVKTLAANLRRSRPELYRELVPVLEFLEPFFELEKTLPKAVCHGDIHPMNVLWKQHRVSKVIDWEFMGMKARIFDMANCLGCVMSEAEDSLERAFATSLLTAYARSVRLEKAEKELFLPAMAALRFGWLAEWLRRSDNEMVEFELFFMNHLSGITANHLWENS